MGKKTSALRIVGLPVGKIGGKIGGKIVGMIVGMTLITGCLPSHAPFIKRRAAPLMRRNIPSDYAQLLPIILPPNITA